MASNRFREKQTNCSFCWRTLGKNGGTTLEKKSSFQSQQKTFWEKIDLCFRRHLAGDILKNGFNLSCSYSGDSNGISENMDKCILCAVCFESAQTLMKFNTELETIEEKVKSLVNCIANFILSSRKQTTTKSVLEDSGRKNKKRSRSVSTDLQDSEFSISEDESGDFFSISNNEVFIVVNVDSGGVEYEPEEVSDYFTTEQEYVQSNEIICDTGITEFSNEEPVDDPIISCEAILADSPSDALNATNQGQNRLDNNFTEIIRPVSTSSSPSASEILPDQNLVGSPEILPLMDYNGRSVSSHSSSSAFESDKFPCFVSNQILMTPRRISHRSGSETSNSDSLEREMSRSTSTPVSHVCHLCNLVFNTTSELIYHVRNTPHGQINTSASPIGNISHQQFNQQQHQNQQLQMREQQQRASKIQDLIHEQQKHAQHQHQLHQQIMQRQTQEQQRLQHPQQHFQDQQIMQQRLQQMQEHQRIQQIQEQQRLQQIAEQKRQIQEQQRLQQIQEQQRLQQIQEQQRLQQIQHQQRLQQSQEKQRLQQVQEQQRLQQIQEQQRLQQQQMREQQIQQQQRQQLLQQQQRLHQYGLQSEPPYQNHQLSYNNLMPPRPPPPQVGSSTVPLGYIDCKICGALFTSVQTGLLQHHVQSQHPQYASQLHPQTQQQHSLFCQLCRMPFGRLDDLKFHECVAHNIPIRCEKCPLTFNAPNQYQLHMECYHSSYPCAACPPPTYPSTASSSLNETHHHSAPPPLVQSAQLQKSPYSNTPANTAMTFNTNSIIKIE